LLVEILVVCIAGTVTFRSYLRQKRAEAFFDFYARLRICVKCIKNFLETNKYLCSDISNKSNIFMYMYPKEDNDDSFHRLEENDMLLLSTYTSELEILLFECKNNVYPKSSRKKKKEWYDSQQVLYEFCKFINAVSKGKQITINYDDKKNKKASHIVKVIELSKSKQITISYNAEINEKAPHIVKVIELRKSMEFILKTIDKTYY
jgi:hypothetical protein